MASAQQIGGTVSDTTGGVLPGVTVEARSPDIIEQVRTAVTDGSGQYLIVALEPGTYSVTYTLPGFTTLVREGIVLSTGFTASVDVQLSVGDIAETVTVSGASPVVDIQNNLQRAVMDREVIDTVPTGKSFQSYALLVPGMEASSQFGTSLNQDSGGITAQTNGALAIHGALPKDGTTALNGMDVSNALSAGAGQMFGLVSDGGMEEMAVETAGHSAEAALGGVQINLVPREGANEFSGAFFGTFTGPGLQGDNIDDDLRARGVQGGPEVDEVWLVNPAFGGPIVRDRLWFYVQNTTQVADVFNPNVFAAVDPASARYVPDTTRPVVSENSTIDTSLNLTWQASAKDKIKVYYSYADWKKPNALAGPLFNLWIAPEGSVDGHYTLGTTQVGWVRPATNRLLFEASASFAPASFDVGANEFAASNVLGLLDAATFTVHRNNHAISQGTHYVSGRRTNAFRGSMTYVTGTHNLKVGVNGTTFREGNTSNTSMQDWTNAISVAGFPLQAQFWLPNLAVNNGAAWGIYVQDQMTFDRLTVNAGLRYDRLGNAYPDQFRDPSIWEPEGLQIPGNESVVGWHDLQPRIGVAYDLFGDGKTALKASANRYGTRSNSEWSALLNPGSAIPLRNQLRLWIDGAPAHFAVPGPPTGFPSCIGPVACVAGDGLVQGDPLNPAPNGELLSPNANLAFGSLQQINFLDPEWSHGWGNRLSNWEITAGVQQELAGGVSLDVTYFRRNFVNFALQDDRMLAASDYDLAAVDLSGLGIAGVGTVTFPELKPEALGRVPDVLFTSANDFGGEEQVFNGVDVTINARLDTLLLQGGLATGATATNFCPAYDAAPEHLGRRGDLVRGTNTYAREFCDASTAWLTQFKLLGSYTLPYDIQVAGTLQSIPGPERQALITVPLTAVAEALGRPSATGVAPGLNALQPGTEYGERFNQFDLRFTKIIPMGETRLRAMFDIFNVFNANAVFSESYAQNNYLTPTGFMPPRLYRFAFQLDF
ncbi:MAG: carboxypeptidase regulatory-like domain-containing protein [Acidobacteria bacterium]|nr:carboxypeptidase regulatory-like domain-containing protein [Acidobacteriota bacterium]